MLTLFKRISAPSRVDGELLLPFEQRQKSRLKATLVTGEEVVIVLERGSVLRSGDCLQGDDGRVVRVIAAEEELMEARALDATVLARAAYHLGNRHAAVQVGDGWLRFAADHVLGELVRGMGISVVAVHAPFEPEAGAYAAGHHHHSSEARHAGIIHDFAVQSRKPS